MEYIMVVIALAGAIVSGVAHNWAALGWSISAGLWALTSRSWRKKYQGNK